MTHVLRRLVQPVTVIVGLAAFLHGPALAQEARDALLQGIDVLELDFDEEQALPLLVRGVDPNGVRDSLWSLGAQYVVDLTWDRDERRARAWAHWLLEVEPTLEPAELLLRPSVVNALREAQSAVAAELSDVTTTSWVWPDDGDLTGPGTLEVGAGLGARVAVVGEAALLPGDRLTLSPGIYTVSADADGFSPASVERAVLPGVATRVTFSLQPAIVAEAERDTLEAIVPEGAPATPPPPPSAQRKKKGFPWLVAVAGAVGAGAAAFFLLGPKDSTVTTRTTDVPITITIP